MLSYDHPFPASMPSLSGCLELEKPAAGSKTYSPLTTDMLGFPILYRTLLASPTSAMCSNTVAHMKRLDRECHLATNATSPTTPAVCERDLFTKLMARRVCDFYEEQHGIFLAECDCISRANVPAKSSVVDACRQRARAEDRAVRDWEAAGGKDANPTALAPTRSLGTAEDVERLCDALERDNVMPPGRATGTNDLFTHLVGRYIIRSAWQRDLSTARDFEDDPPSPYCVYSPCRVDDSTAFHVPYSEYTDAIGRCPVDRCQVNIIRRGLNATGTTSIANNVFNINCDGGVCKPDDATRERVEAAINEAEVQRLVTGGGAAAEGEEQGYALSDVDRTRRCGKFGRCLPNGRCQCEEGWTGEVCRQQVRPPPVVITPSDPPEIPSASAPSAIIREKVKESAISKVPVWVWPVGGVALLMVLYIIFGPSTPSVVRRIRKRRAVAAA